MERYTENHEWIDTETGKFGISSYAVAQLGEVTFIDLPVIGTSVKEGDIVATVESVKTASEIYSPVSGKIIAVNETLKENPSLLNIGNWKSSYIGIIEPVDKNDYASLKTKEEYEKSLI